MKMIEAVFNPPVVDGAGVKWQIDPAVINPTNPEKTVVFEPQRATVFETVMSKRKNDKDLKQPDKFHKNHKSRVKPNGIDPKIGSDYFRHPSVTPTRYVPPGSKKSGN
jgi:hypothetical protein